MSVFIKREILNSIINHLKKKEITLLVGPRQSGKTTLLLKVKSYLEQKNKKTVFFNLDFEEEKTYFKNQMDLVSYLNLQFGDNEGYVFIDEIQRLENAGLFLKGLYDRNLPYKFIVSGSGSLELKEKIHESLVGRKRIFEINTLSLKEFINFKTEYKYETKLFDFFKFDKVKPDKLYKEYLTFGGYPRVVLAKTIQEKKEIMMDIFQSYLEKDIQNLIKIEKKEAFTNLVTILSAQIGQLTNNVELSRTLSIDQETIKKYLFYLEKTFIVKKILPFFKNPKKELSKTPLFYFNDLGLRNFALTGWTTKESSENDGFLFQNLIFLLLTNSKRYHDYKINYWRTKDQAEVDFIINFGINQIPIEVKYSFPKNYSISKSLRNFIIKYKPKEIKVINKIEERNLLIGNSRVEIIPYWRLI